MEDQDLSNIPLYTKVGTVISMVVIVVLLAMIFRNCVGSIVHGTATESADIERYYDAGFSDGKSGRTSWAGELATENPLLIKSYNKGYREGLDSRPEPAD